MTRRAALALCALAAAAGCRGDRPAAERATNEAAAPAPAAAPTAALVTGPGVEVADRTIRVGVLGGAGGPAEAMAEPHAIGLRLVADMAGGGALLPGSWKLELVERDGGGDAEAAVAAYQELAAQVLYIGMSFGTESTVALLERLDADGLVAFAAPPSTSLADAARAPSVLPSPAIEAMRALDFAVAEAGGAAAVRAAIVYAPESGGGEALAGFRRAAEHHALPLAGEHAVTGELDARALVRALREAEVSHVVLALPPVAVARLVDAALLAGHRPMWIGTTASWTDYFFSPVSAAEPAALARFRWVTGLPTWGEDVPGMNLFLAAWDRHGTALGQGADFHVLAGYITGLAQLEALERAIDGNDLSRDGFFRALRSIEAFDAGGLIPPVDLSRSPHASVKTRVLAPDFATRSWRVVGGWAAPRALDGRSEARPGQTGKPVE